MAKILIKADTGDIVSMIPDEYDFGSRETVPKFWRLQVTDLTFAQIQVFLVGEYETVNWYDGATFLGSKQEPYLSFFRWFFDFTDAPEYLAALQAGDTVQVTASQVRQKKLLRNKRTGNAVTPSDFNTPDHTPHRTRDDDVRNHPNSPLPPELGGDPLVWADFILWFTQD